MKKKAFANHDFIRTPAYPYTGTEVFSRLRNALTMTLGFEPSFLRLAQMMGQALSNTHYWFYGFPHPQVIAFLSLLERLPERQRSELLNSYCRELPELDHPRLAHDPLAVSALTGLLQIECGLTLVKGTPFQQPVVLTALGHKFQRISRRATVSGLDIHQPRKWVPLETVLYFREPLRLSTLRENIGQAWPLIDSTTAKLVLLNGIWSTRADLQPEILNMARKRHVVIADTNLPDPASLRTKVGMEVQIVTIEPSREDDITIRLRVERF